MCNKVLKKIKDNLEEATDIFNDEYSYQASIIGEEMLYDQRYVQEDEIDQWEEDLEGLYENYAHTQGHQANYDAASAVLDAYQDNDDCECGEEILEDILVLLGKEVL